MDNRSAIVDPNFLDLSTILAYRREHPGANTVRLGTQARKSLCRSGPQPGVRCSRLEIIGRKDHS